MRNRRLDGVGDWILQRNEFQSWSNSRDGEEDVILRCYGGQGVGKTYIRYKSIFQKPETMLTRKLSSLVIDTLREQARGQNIAVLYLYCDYQDQKDQSAVNMIGSLLRQMAVAAGRIPDEIQSSFEQSSQGGIQDLRLPDMLKLFAKTFSPIKRVYICVDAIDELQPHHQSKLLHSLRQIIEDAPNTPIFLTGRPHISGEVGRHLKKGTFSICVIPDKGYIASYLRRKIEDDNARDPKLMTEDLKNDIMNTVLEKASEM